METDSAGNIIQISEMSSEQFNWKSERIPDNVESLQRRSEYTDKGQDLPDLFLHEEKLNKSSSETSRHSKINLPEDLRELLELVRASGNRITQRELRKKSPYSESKVSLMLSDLEERGLIEKFKRGRGNIIRIPDMHLSRQTDRKEKKE
jgi:uncharacterized membrane protein